MNSALLQCLTFWLLCFPFSLGSRVADRPLLKATTHDTILVKQERKILFSPSISNTEFDSFDTTPSIPIVNPTTPDSPIPTINPTTPDSPIPTINPPPSAPVSMQPPTTPTTPPSMNPQNPPPGPTAQGTSPPNPTTTAPTASGGAWCVAKPDSSPNSLQVALDYACGFGGTDCSAIQPGASCYNPNTVRDHASYAFNDYYHKHPGPNSCDFDGLAQLTNTDPSSGSCHYSSSSTSSPSITPPAMPTPPEAPTMTTPTTMTPTTPMTTPPTTTTPTTTFPGGSTDFGGEPTGLPNAANPKSCCFLFLLTIIGLFGSLLPGSYP